MAMVVVDDSSL